MRGILITVRADLTAERIIPAYAGNIKLSDAGGGKNWDHPRVCGEYVCAVDGKLSDAGSSPRMRGICISPRGVVMVSRIIPAYAGNIA